MCRWFQSMATGRCMEVGGEVSRGGVGNAEEE